MSMCSGDQMPVGTCLEEILRFGFAERRKGHSEPSLRDTDDVGDGQSHGESLKHRPSAEAGCGTKDRSSLTNAATMSQSSALEPEHFCLCRRCKRRITAIPASAMKTALVAIIARDAEVVMVERASETVGFGGGERREGVFFFFFSFLGIEVSGHSEWITHVSVLFL